MKKWFTKKIYNLLDKATESALLAVDLYNKPKTDFRSWAYIVLMTIAWTSLLHAVFEKKKIKYYYTKWDIKKKKIISWDEYFYFKKRKSKEYVKIDWDKKAWELWECISEYFWKNHSIYKNINLFIKLRNKIEHRFMPEIDNSIIWECQALILNFEDILVEHFWKDFSLVDSIFIPLQLSKSNKKIPISNDWKEVLNFINNYRSAIDTSIKNSQSFSFKVFVMPNIWRNRNTADAAIEYVPFDESNPEEMERYEEAVIAIRSKYKRRYKPQQVLDRISEKKWIEKTLYWHTQMWKKYNPRPSQKNRNDLCKTDLCEWDNELTNSYLYFDKWIDLLITKEIDNTTSV